ncbi:MAG: hypothetical protein RLZZ57_1695 [Pseudomonadota bacterium]|jgi:hypothetical protein
MLCKNRSNFCERRDLQCQHSDSPSFSGAAAGPSEDGEFRAGLDARMSRWQPLHRMFPV